MSGEATEVGAATGAVSGVPRILLRLEGMALLIAALYAYYYCGGPWLLFVVLFFVPDLSFLAYLVSPRLGSIAYNSVHSTLAPLALLAIGLAAGAPLARDIALIWLAHVGFDRMLGYGFKYATGFGDTHLGLIGKGQLKS